MVCVCVYMCMCVCTCVCECVCVSVCVCVCLTRPLCTHTCGTCSICIHYTADHSIHVAMWRRLFCGCSCVVCVVCFMYMCVYTCMCVMCVFTCVMCALMCFCVAGCPQCVQYHHPKVLQFVFNVLTTTVCEGVEPKCVRNQRSVLIQMQLAAYEVWCFLYVGRYAEPHAHTHRLEFYICTQL